VTDPEFVEAVRAMRTLQRRYFAGKNTIVLAESKRAERAVDAELKRREGLDARPGLFDKEGDRAAQG
jgi:hypothetical protein